jgi:hypothetical protein
MPNMKYGTITWGKEQKWREWNGCSRMLLRNLPQDVNALLSCMGKRARIFFLNLKIYVNLFNILNYKDLREGSVFLIYTFPPWYPGVGPHVL